MKQEQQPLITEEAKDPPCPIIHGAGNSGRSENHRRNTM